MTDNNNVNITANFVDNASAGLENLSTLLGDFGKGVAIGALTAGLALLVTNFASATKAAIDFGDAINDMSERWGVATDALSGMAYAAQLSDTSLEGLSAGFRGLAKSIEEASDPASESAQLFEQMGISLQDASGKTKDADTLMGELGDKFKEMPNGMEKARLAIQLFGKAGAELIPYLNQGKEGMAALKKESEEFGLTWGADAAAQAGQFNDNVDRMSGAVKGFFTQIAQYLLPTLLEVTEALIQSAKEGGVLRGVFDALKGVVILINETAFKPIAIVIYALTAAFGMLGKAIGGAAASLVMFLSGDFAGAASTLKSLGDDVMKTGEDIVNFGKKMYGAGDGAGELGKKADGFVPKVTKAGEAAKKAAEEFEKYLATIRKERDEVGASDEYKKQLELQEKLLALKKAGTSPAKIEQYASQAQAILEELAAKKQYNDELNKQLDAEIKLNEARTSVVDATEQLKFENSIMHLSNEERKIAIELRKLEKSMVGATTEEIAKLSAEREKELRLQQKQNELEGLLSGTLDVRIEKSRHNMKILTDALTEGAISEKTYLEAVGLEMERMSGKAKVVADEITEFFKEAARNIQSAMSDFIFDFMQGKMTDLGTQMKTMLDRMVANFLAAKIATSLFGSDFGTANGTVGGLVGAGITAIAGARAEGGPVTAGRTYLVGEKRAELFTPSTNGTIIPDTSSLNSSSSTKVNINISALDGADTMRVLSNYKKEIANMVSSTNRTYNLRGA